MSSTSPRPSTQGALELPDELPSPCYVLDESRLLANLRIVDELRERSGARSLLALKCFASWGVSELIAQHLDGTTSSSLYEARLGHEQFGGETHAYAVAFTRAEIAEVATFADRIILNSTTQLRAHEDLLVGRSLGLRVNPGVSHSHYDLADPARPQSRLGVSDPADLAEVLTQVDTQVDGLMFHVNCENDDLDALHAIVDAIGERYSAALRQVSWVSLGGGIAFTAPGYPVAGLAVLLKGFAQRFDVQVYLEPGDAVVKGAGELVTTVVDVVRNEGDVAIVDSSVEAHLLDHLIYATTPELVAPRSGPHRVAIAGRTCLAGDVFGTYDLEQPLAVGDRVRFADAAGYSIVKASWFNGIARPAIAVRRLDGSVEVLRTFGYEDYRISLS
jgi:carboxynorspermidine decarboxylase